MIAITATLSAVVTTIAVSAAFGAVTGLLVRRRIIGAAGHMRDKATTATAGFRQYAVDTYTRVSVAAHGISLVKRK